MATLRFSRSTDSFEPDFDRFLTYDVLVATSTEWRISNGVDDTVVYRGRDLVYVNSFPVAGLITSVEGGFGGVTDSLQQGIARDAGAFGAAIATATPDDDVAVILAGLPGRDTVTGSPDGDSILSGAGNDRLNGGGGDDWLSGNAGADTLDGGAGIDRAVYRFATGPVTARLDGGRGRGEAAGDVYRSIEELEGSAFADLLVGNRLDNYFKANAGTDTVRGGAGDDIMSGGLGADLLDGGLGFDLVSYFFSEAAVRVALSGQRRGGEATGDRFVSIEGVFGSTRDDTLAGDTRENRLDGGADGDDILNGGGGGDFIDGRAGADTMTGGAGADVFDYDDGAESRAGARDTVIDFRPGTDLFDFSDLDADPDGVGRQRADFLGSAGFTGLGAELRFASGVLLGDFDGDRRAEFAVNVRGVARLTEGDFDLG